MDDPAKRIGDMEDQLAEQKHDADLRPAHHHAEKAFRDKEATRRVLIYVALVFTFGAGFWVMAHGLEREAVPRGVVWLGVAILVLSGCGLIKAIAGLMKKRELRDPDTVQLLTVASSRCGSVGSIRDRFELTSEMQIRLDSGQTFRGSYQAIVGPQRMREWWWRAFPPDSGRLRRRITPQEALDAWFHVGASLLCEYNPKYPNKVVVFPFAARGDRVTYNLNPSGDDHVSFYSAT